MENKVSGLSFIETKDSNPFNLFKEWMEENILCSNNKTISLNLATASRTGNNVSNRTVLLKELKEDGFAFYTTKMSKKISQIKENPNVAACFVWMYEKNGQQILRQVRVEGTAEELPRSDSQKYFKEEPLFCKIRANICPQGSEIEWNDLKRKHDEVLHQVVEGGLELELPEYQVAYIIKPTSMDFYFAHDNCIADRICFTKENGSWNFQRISA